MQCPHCGAEVIEGNRFCQQCRKRVTAPSGGIDPAVPAPADPPPAASPFAAPLVSYPYGQTRPPAAAPVAVVMNRPGVVTAIAVLDILVGLLFLIGGLGLFFSGIGGGADAAFSIGLGVVYLALSALTLTTAIGLLQLKSWARTTRIVLAVIGLLGVPCGTLLSIAILVYLLKPGVKVLFSGRSASQLTAQEANDVATVTQGGSTAVVIVVVAVVLVGIVMIGIVAAIAIPSLLHARIAANEADAIGDLHSMISAEATYPMASGGRFGTLECLATPSSCIPGYSGAAFLDQESAKAVKRGYRRQLTVSPDGLHYTIVAVPVTFGSTGTRVFCTDETTLICQSNSQYDFADGICGTHCMRLQ